MRDVSDHNIYKDWQITLIYTLPPPIGCAARLPNSLKTTICHADKNERAGSAEIQFLVLTDNNIEDYSPLLEIEGLKAVSFDFDKGNGKEIAEKLTEKGCIASNDKWVPYRMFWEILEQSES